MTKQIYQIHILLQGSKPRIWRRFLTKPDILLVDFHRIIQTVMGWTNSHLHQFVKGRDWYAPEEFEIEDAKNSRNVKLNSLLKREKDSINYEYDFGDGWMHKIVLEKILPFDNTLKIPVCLAGKGNCPPEDCGGIWGYEDLKTIMENPGHKEYQETIEWLGVIFDPNYFEVKDINQMLSYPDYGCIWIE